MSFQQKEARVEGQTVRYIDERPDDQVGPDTILVPGFNEPSPTFDPVISSLVRDKNRHVFSVTNEHGIHTKRRGNIPHAQQRHASALLGMINAERLRRTDAVGHSQGSIVLAGAASQNPGAFRKMILYAPSGLRENETIGSLASRLPADLRERAKAMGKVKQSRREDLLEHARIVGAACKWDIVRNPLASLKEIMGVSRARIGDILKRLQNDNGIRIAVIAPDRDRLTPIAEYPEDVIRVTGIREKDFHVVPGTHIMHMEDPDVFADVLEKAWQELDRDA